MGRHLSGQHERQQSDRALVDIGVIAMRLEAQAGIQKSHLGA